MEEDPEDPEHGSSDVEVTVISSELPPPVTYIGNPSEELGQTSDTPEVTPTEAGSSDSQPSVIIESGPVLSEYVMMPGEVIRRRGSILKNSNSTVSKLFLSFFQLSVKSNFAIDLVFHCYAL